MACCEKRQEIPFWSWRSSPNSCWLYIAFLPKAWTEDMSLEAEWHRFKQAFGETPCINLFRCTLWVRSCLNREQEQESLLFSAARTYRKQYLWVQWINSELNERKWIKLEGIYIRASVCVHLLLVLTLTLWAFLLAFTITSLHHGPSI